MPKVTIYSMPTCPFCKMAKQYFSQHKVEYQEKDVTSDAKAHEAMIAKSGQTGVPVTVIQKDDQEQVVVGFDQPKLAKLLGVR